MYWSWWPRVGPRTPCLTKKTKHLWLHKGTVRTSCTRRCRPFLGEALVSKRKQTNTQNERSGNVKMQSEPPVQEDMALSSETSFRPFKKSILITRGKTPALLTQR